tara:strand:+ start:1033 stop:1383 length:351 start_codon:yes stop_codon:yes gene_type:complete
MRVFYIYFKGFEPPQMLIKFPYPAQYPPKNWGGTDPDGPIIYLFVEGCKEVTGVEPPAKLELFKEGLNHPLHQDVPGLTKDGLMERFEVLFNSPPSSVEVVALESQCDLIRGTRFK